MVHDDGAAIVGRGGAVCGQLVIVIGGDDTLQHGQQGHARIWRRWLEPVMGDPA